MGEFTAEVRHRGGAGVIDLRGDLDGTGQATLDRAYAQAAEAHPDVLVLHFGEVGFVNSTGIALIVGLLARARATGTPVRVVGLSEHYRHVFEITRLAEFVAIAASEEDAVASGTVPPS